jgi:xanthosine utilization system XapX-like protein
MKGKYEEKKNPSKKIGSLLLEILGEVAVMLVFMLAGVGVFWLFGKQSVIENIDPDTLCLIGIIVILVGYYVISTIVRLIRKKKTRDIAEQENID